MGKGLELETVPLDYAINLLDAKWDSYFNSS